MSDNSRQDADQQRGAADQGTNQEQVGPEHGLEVTMGELRIEARRLSQTYSADNDNEVDEPPSHKIPERFEDESEEDEEDTYEGSEAAEAAEALELETSQEVGSELSEEPIVERIESVRAVEIVVQETEDRISIEAEAIQLEADADEELEEEGEGEEQDQGEVNEEEVQEEQEEEQQQGEEEQEEQHQQQEEEQGEQEGDDDFDDFEEFDEFEEPAVENVYIARTAGTSHHGGQFPCLHETDFADSIELQARVLANLEPLSAHDSPKISAADTSSPPLVEKSAVYFTERSYSLWKQLALMTPQLHSIDWRRSSIRRLLLLSLGIPLDLDQVLPKKDTKRLVLPSTSRSQARRRSEAALGADGKNNAKNSSANKNKNKGTTTTSNNNNNNNESKMEDFDEETEADLARWRTMAEVSGEALDNMSIEELEQHVSALKKALTDAEKICMQWQLKKDAAIQDKEAFEGVIESLLEYAQRLRRKR